MAIILIMKKLNLPLILDSFLCFTCGFLLVFTAVRFYTNSALFGVICGIVAALLIGGVAFFYISKKQNKSLVLNFDQKSKNLLKAHLALCSNEHITVLFLKLFGESAKTKNGKIVLDGKTLFFNFKFAPLNLDDVAPIIKSPEECKAVYCNEICADALNLLLTFEIKVLTVDKIYGLLKKADLLPKEYLFKERAKQSLANRIKLRFNRKLFAPLFWCGVALIGLSYFTFFPIYYIISGGVLLFIAGFLLVFGKKT